MSQFRIKGIDYPDESLEHGLGKGSGRGRPVGSKNGRVMPGAAYMKDYKIVGQEAEGDSKLPTGQTRRSSTNTSLNTYGNSGRRNTGSGATGKSIWGNMPRTTQQRQIPKGQMRKSSNAPASAVSKGKNAVTQMMSGNRVIPTTDERTKVIQTQDMRTKPQQVIQTQDARTKTTQATVPAGNVDPRMMSLNGGNRNVQGVNPAQNPAVDVRGIANKPVQMQNPATPAVQNNGPQAVPSNQTGGVAAAENQPEAREEIQKNDAPKETNYVPEQKKSFWDQLGDAWNGATGAIGDAWNGVTGAVNGLFNPNQSAENPNAGAEPTVRVEANDAPKETNYVPDEASKETREETPEQKSFWDRVGGWFSQAGKDIGDTVVGAWNTASGAVNDAAVWVGDRLKEGGEWALASMGDVGEWIGDRAKDLDYLWNGRDVEVQDENGRWVQGHQTGIGEAIGNWWNGTDTRVQNADGTYRPSHQAGFAERAGNWLNQAGKDISRTADEVWNGRDVEANDNGRWRQGHEAGLRENLENFWNNSIAKPVTDWWNGTDTEVRKPGPVNENNPNIRSTVVETEHTPGARENIENAWRDITSAANAVGQGVSNFVNGVRPGEAQPYYDVNSGKWVDPTMPSIGERIQGGLNAAGQWIGDTANNAWNGVTRAANDFGQWVGNTANNAGQWLGDNFVTPITNGVNSGIDFVRNTTNDISNRMATGASTSRALDSGVAPSEVETYQRMLSDGSITPETYNNVVSSLSNIQNVDRAAAQAGWDGIPADVREMNEKENNSLGQRIGNAAQNVWNGISDTAQNVANGVGNAANEVNKYLNGFESDGYYVPGAIDNLPFLWGGTPQYVNQYYDKSNPNREYYWPATLWYYDRTNPGALDNRNPLTSGIMPMDPIALNELRNNNPYEKNK